MTHENIKITCRECNELRGMTGHCVGAMACVRAVDRRRSEFPATIKMLGIKMPMSPRDVAQANEWITQVPQTRYS